MILHVVIYLENFRHNLVDHMKDYVLHFSYFSPNDLSSFILILEEWWHYPNCNFFVFIWFDENAIY